MSCNGACVCACTKVGVKTAGTGHEHGTVRPQNVNIGSDRRDGPGVERDVRVWCRFLVSGSKTVEPSTNRECPVEDSVTDPWTKGTRDVRLF